jgi:hypothetical protein
MLHERSVPYSEGNSNSRIAEGIKSPIAEGIKLFKNPLRRAEYQILYNNFHNT